MPRNGCRRNPSRSSRGEIRILRAWINQGADWPEPPRRPQRTVGKAMVVTAEDRQHWSYRPLDHVDPPEGRRCGVVSHADRPVRPRAPSKSNGIRANALADRRTLIRRVYFDLLGLPPSPEEVKAFVADPAPDAYEKLVDRLLASPHYGERWGRHWLDVARYADSDGLESDADRPTAYHYRDFVIRALNDDMPYRDVRALADRGR